MSRPAPVNRSPWRTAVLPGPRSGTDGGENRRKKSMARPVDVISTVGILTEMPVYQILLGDWGQTAH